MRAVPPGPATSMPVARAPSNAMRVAWRPVSTVRLGRASAGRRNATDRAAAPAAALRHLVEARPVLFAPLKSAFRARPVATADSTKARDAAAGLARSATVSSPPTAVPGIRPALLVLGAAEDRQHVS